MEPRRESDGALALSGERELAPPYHCAGQAEARDEHRPGCGLRNRTGVSEPMTDVVDIGDVPTVPTLIRKLRWLTGSSGPKPACR